jgi:2-methylisocitrate lyase-like PEP mutase family enzyme
MTSPADRLRDLLDASGAVVAPACFDALSARLIARAGFDLTFMSGFAVSAARLGLPDTGLISYAEMVEQGRNICGAVSIPVIGDADTGYGNALNVKRTVEGYARAGFACAMIEDQVTPKRCGHTAGKQVVARDEALSRIRAAVDARDEGADILVMARTDARATDGFDEAMWRIQAFADLGADILFLEAPRSEDEMRRFCAGVAGPKMANLVEQGDTPLLPPAALGEMGFKIVLYPLTALNAAMSGMVDALATLAEGRSPEGLLDFSEVRDLVGFTDYERAAKKYAIGG